jgi:hypothetical protein
MTPLVSEPVILRVVRVIERVNEGLETSDGGFLREILCDHIDMHYLTLNSDGHLVAAVDRAFPAN